MSLFSIGPNQRRKTITVLSGYFVSDVKDVYVIDVDIRRGNIVITCEEYDLYVKVTTILLYLIRYRLITL